MAKAYAETKRNLGVLLARYLLEPTVCFSSLFFSTHARHNVADHISMF